MDSIKSNFYSCFPIKNSELNKTISTKQIFGKHKQQYDTSTSTRTNIYAEKLIDLINASRDIKINYDYLLGWECAKIILPKVCIDIKYVVRIMIVMQTSYFIQGFYDYAKYQFSKFEFEKSFILSYFSNKNVQDLFPNEKINLWHISRNFNQYDKKENKELIYDGLVSSDYYIIQNLHPKGFFLNIIPRYLATIRIMFCGFLFKNNILIDNPILSEILIMSNTIHHNSRKSSDICNLIPEKPSNTSQEIFDKVYKDMEIDNILNNLASRSKQMNIFDYCAIWSEHNEELLKIKQSVFDILDFDRIEETKSPDDSNYNNQ